MSRLRSTLILTAAALAAVGVAASAVPTASALEVEHAPAWRAIEAMAEDAGQRSSYAPALAWLAERGPIRAPITDADDVEAMLSLAQAWAARGDQRIERGAPNDGLSDLAEVLRHGAAVERHAHNLQARQTGARIQQLALEILAVAPLDDLTGAQRAALLMVLGESAVLPSPAETLQRQCALDAATLRTDHQRAPLWSLDRWLTNIDTSARRLQASCTEPLDGSIWNTRGAAAVTAAAAENRAATEAVRALVDDNAAARAALQGALSGRLSPETRGR